MPAVLADPEPILIEEPPKIRTGGPGGGGPRDLDPDDGGGGGDDDDHEAQSDGRQNVAGAGLLAIRFVLVSITALFIAIAVVYFARSQSSSHWTAVGVPSFLWL